MKQNPFSLYDFLGYFIPGIFLTFAITIIPICKRPDIQSLEAALNSISSLKTEGIVLVIITSYLLGHILSFLSSITVEKYAAWRYDFPSRYLLGMKTRKFSAHMKTFHGRFWGITIILLLLPTCIFDYVLGKFFGFRRFYVRSLDKELSKIIFFKINCLCEKLGITKENGFRYGGGNNSDFFRIIQHYTYEYSKNHQFKFTNYVALFGFLRTITFIMNMLFWYLVWHMVFLPQINILSIILVFSASIISYICFMAFMKFYRRYTLEGFMVLVVDKDIK